MRWQLRASRWSRSLAVVAGIVGTASAMFLSDHDFDVVAVGVPWWPGWSPSLVAMAVGAALVRWSRALRDDARAFGESGRVRRPAAAVRPSCTALSDELARTSERLAESRARETRLEESRRELVVLGLPRPAHARWPGCGR